MEGHPRHSARTGGYPVRGSESPCGTGRNTENTASSALIPWTLRQRRGGRSVGRPRPGLGLPRPASPSPRSPPDPPPRSPSQCRVTGCGQFPCEYRTSPSASLHTGSRHPSGCHLARTDEEYARRGPQAADGRVQDDSHDRQRAQPARRAIVSFRAPNWLMEMAKVGRPRIPSAGFPGT